MKLKRFFLITLITTFALFSAAYAGNDNLEINSSTSDVAQLPNPFQPCDTMSDAEKVAGFELILPKTADKLEAVENEMIQALYGKDGSDMLIRKAHASGNISGDYNEYSQIKIVDGITLKGKDGKFFLALWTNGKYSYSISVGSALSQADIMALADGVK